MSNDNPGENKDSKRELKTLLMDLLAVLIVLLLIFASLYTYLGRYPFVVVVKSGSMMHGDDSAVGIIDTGDLVFVKDVERREDIVTYVEGEKKGYKRFGSYGDVIIYKRNGDNSTIPIIHRAVVWIEANLSGARYSYDVPSLKLYNITTRFVIQDYGYRKRDIVVDVSRILAIFSHLRLTPHSGFITKGDNNLFVDQNSNFTGPVQYILPVKLSWIVGKAVGELPWFGLVKLYLNGEVGEGVGKEPVPPSSRRGLIISLSVIVFITFILPYIIEVAYRAVKKRGGEGGVEEVPSQPPPGRTMPRASPGKRPPRPPPAPWR